LGLSDCFLEGLGSGFVEDGLVRTTGAGGAVGEGVMERGADGLMLREGGAVREGGGESGAGSSSFSCASLFMFIIPTTTVSCVEIVTVWF